MTKKNSKSKPLINKQSLFLSALRKKLVELDDPDPDIITHESYTYTETTRSGFGKIPKITFKPYGKNRKIKADIMRSSGIYDPAVEKEIAKIRQKYNPIQANQKEDIILEKRFDSFWNAYWKSIRRSLNRIEQAQKLFITSGDEQISIPFQILGVTPKAKKEEINKKKSKNYMDELMEVE